jgi:glycerol-3-phosphate acyltransferase PlsY
VAMWLSSARDAALLLLLLTTLLWIMHRDNIRRLLAGREGKIGGKSAATPPA